MQFVLRILALSALICTAGCDSFRSADFSDLDDGWNEISGGGDTICSDGSDYRFFARPGDPQKLLIYFQGGGACWNGRSCDPDLDPTYIVNTDRLDLSRAHGIFAFEEEANPFRDHSVVVAPYCSGDVHLGDAVTAYEAPTTRQHPSHTYEVQHRGHANGLAVLDWVYAHFFRPESIFVTGSSAGSIPSPYYAMLVAEQYPDAALTQLGDASSGYRREVMSSVPEAVWGTLDIINELPELAETRLGEFTNELLYVVAGQRFPGHQFAAFDNAEDQVQKRFLEMGGYRANTIREFILRNQADIRAEIDNFVSFIAGGEEHTILLRPEFYTLHVGESTLLDWVASLASHEPVEDVACSSCGRAEYLQSDVASEQSAP